MSNSTTTETAAASGVPSRGWRSHFGRFVGNRDGSTAIEFTALAIPFAMLVFAILESCISFAAQEVLTNATYDIARQLRTGQLRKEDVTENSLKKMICDRLDIIVSGGCLSDLLVDLRTFDTFAEASKSKFRVTEGEIVLTKGAVADPKQFVVEPGPALTKNMLRVFYKWPVITDFLRKAMSNLSDNKTLHFASVTWQNEPFDD